MKRQRKRKSETGVIKQRYFRKLQKAHSQILKQLNYYKNAEEN